MQIGLLTSVIDSITDITYYYMKLFKILPKIALY